MTSRVAGRGARREPKDDLPVTTASATSVGARDGASTTPSVTRTRAGAPCPEEDPVSAAGLARHEAHCS